MKLDVCDAIFVSKKSLFNFFKFVFFRGLNEIGC